MFGFVHLPEYKISIFEGDTIEGEVVSIKWEDIKEIDYERPGKK